MLNIESIKCEAEKRIDSQETITITRNELATIQAKAICVYVMKNPMAMILTDEFNKVAALSMAVAFGDIKIPSDDKKEENK